MLQGATGSRRTAESRRKAESGKVRREHDIQLRAWKTNNNFPDNIRKHYTEYFYKESNIEYIIFLNRLQSGFRMYIWWWFELRGKKTEVNLFM